MPTLEQCAKKFGKALSANDLDTIREMGGDPQAYLDQLMAEREKYFPQTLSQSDRKVGIKADIGRLSSLLGPQLYGKLEDIGQVTVKELFQNAFDGVKDLGGTGSIEITTDDNANTITVTDNGIGMTTDTVENAFLTVAGTQKSSDRASGGFGIAKMLFLFGNEEIALETVHDGVRTFFRSTGAEIMEAASGEGEQLNLEVDNVDMPNGTTVVVKIPTEYVDPSTGETKQIYMPNNYNLEDMILNSPLFEDIEVVFNHNILPIGRNFPKDDYTNYANVKFAWGNIRVVVKKDKNDGPSWQSNVSVLSEGIYQFGDSIQFGPMYSQKKVPYKFFFNIEPSVAADEIGYPIAINRKSYSHAVQSDVNRLKAHISARYAMTDIGESSNSFGSIEMINPVNGESTFVDLTPKVRTDTQAFVVKQGGTIEVEEGRLVVDGVEVPEFTTRDMEEFVPDMSEFKIDQSLVDPDQPFIHSNVTLDGGPLVDNLRKEFGVDEVNEYLLVFGDVFKELRDMVISVGGGSYQGMEDVPVGVSFDNQYYGVHFKVPFRGMAINPGVTILDEHGPVFKANALLTTMVHEIAHYRYMSHDPATFINENQRLMSLLLSFETIGDNVINITKLKERLSSNIEKHGDIYERLRIGYEDGSVENSGTKLEESARQPIGSPRDDSGTEGESGAGQLDAEGVRQTTGPDTGGNTEGGNDGAVDSQPEGPIDDLTSDIVSTPKPLILSQEAQRNEDGFYSAVEQAVLDMNLPEWKKEDGQAKGKVIWQKLVKAAGIKEEETNWMGLEEWLHADPNEKFTRDEVADFINMKGIKVTQVMAGFDEDYDPEEDGYEDIQWDSGTPDNDSENWAHRVDDMLYEYDNNLEDDMVQHFFKKWVSENLDNELFTELLEETIEDTTTEDKGDQEVRVDIVEAEGGFKLVPRWTIDNQEVQNQYRQPVYPTREEAQERIDTLYDSIRNDAGVPMYGRKDTTTTTRQNEDFDVTLRDLIEAEDLDGVIEHVGINAIAPAARRDYEEYAEEQAEEEYMQEPYMEYRSQNTDDNMTIHGNDDIGYTIRINNDVQEIGGVYSLNEAQIEAEEHAREYGVEIGEGGGARPSENRPRWGDHISSGESVNYREQKLTMPNIGGDFYHPVHFDDRNVVAFNRMTDRMEGDIKELRLEESQSDWESQARKGEGYQSGANVNDIKEERALIHGQVDQLLDSIYEGPAPLEEFTAEEAEKLIADSIANNPIDPLWDDTPLSSGRRLWTKDFNGIYRSVSPFDSIEHSAELFALGNPFYIAHPEQYVRDNKSEFSNAAWTVIRADSLQSIRGTPLVMASANSIANIGSALEDNQTLFVELRELVREYDALSGQLAREQSGVVNQPYKGNAWTNLALKYAIKAAIDGGYDQFAWSDNKTIQGTWSPGYSYAAQYDQKMPSMVKKLTGQKARHVQHDGSPLEPVRTLEQLRNEAKITEAEARDMVETSEGPADGPWIEIIDETGTRVGDLEQVHKSLTRPQDGSNRRMEYLIDNLNEGDTINFYNGDFVTHHRLLERTADQGKWVIDITDDVKAKFAERQTLMQEEDKGQLIIMPNGERIIKLTQSSNLSSFLHESAHLFLEIEKQFADEFGATAKHDAILKWLGATDLSQITAATPEGVEMHEKFARGFEAYLREGKAPSVELRDAFAAFRSWLEKIYTYIKELNVELNDEIRTVFDRMLATDAEILEAMSTPAYEELFTSIEQAGMSDTAWADYQKKLEQRKNRVTETIDQKLMKELTARRSKEWNDEREPLIEEETQRLAAEPRYQLFADLDKAPFNRALVKLAMDIKKLPTRLRGKTVEKEGVDPAEYAEFYGYDSVAEMLTEITEMPTLKQAALDAAQARMIEMHGDILNDGTLEAEVQEALHSDATANILLAELKALKPKRKQLFNREMLKAEAKRIISTMTYRQILPNKYYRAEVRAAKRATGDDAYEAKLAQLANHYLYREALEARKAMERHRKYIKGVQKRKYDNKSVSEEFIANLKALSNVYDMGKNPERQRATLNGILSWFNDMVASGELEMQLMDSNLVLAMEARARGEMGSFKLPTFDDLTSSDLRGLYEMLRHIRFVGGQESDIQASEIAADRHELNTSINDNGGRNVSDPERVGRTAPKWDQVKHLANKLPSLRNLIRKLDGFDKQSDGVANRLIYRLIEDANNYKLDLTNRVYDKFQTELDNIHHIGLSKKEVSIVTEAGNKVTMNYEELFMLALYWGTESSRDAIREGHGFVDNDVTRLLTNLTPDQLEMVNAVWNVNESIWPDLSSASVNRYGVSPEKLDAVPYEVNGISMSGGHMRLFYNSLDIDLANEQKQGEQYATIIPSKAGSLHERVGSGGRPVLLDRNNIIRSLEESIHFIAFAENSQKIRRVINAKDIKESIQRKHGVPFHRALIEQLDNLTRNQRAREVYPGLASAFRLLRKAATYRHLVLSIRNIVQQFSAIPIAGSEVGAINLGNAAMTIMFDGGAAKDSILEKSAFMRNRTSFVNREAAEYLKQLSVDGAAATAWQSFANIGFTPQTVVDAMIAFPTWLARYEQGINTHGDERRAVSDADVSVSESVGSGADIHLGGAFNSNTTEFARTMTLFGSWFNSYYQRMYRETEGFSELSFAGVNAVLTMPIMIGVLSSMLVMDFPDDDDDESWAAYVATRGGVFLAGAFPIVRDVVSFAYSGFTPKTVMAGAQEGPTKLYSEIESFFSGNQSGLKTASDVTKVVSTFVPIPGSGQVTRVADFVDSYNQGNEGKLTPLKVYQAAVEGPDRNN